MPMILIVDDEARIRDVVQYALEKEGYEVTTAPDGSAALTRLAKGGVDLVVLDILMPELDGLAVCRRMRENPATARTPIIFLSSRAEEVDRINGLEMGGDDYVSKPFSPRELGSRVKAVLRRAALAAPASGAAGDKAKPGEREIIVHGKIEIDLPRHEIRVSGKKVDMTVTEFGVLQALLERPGRVLTRDQLITRAYAHDNVITERTIDTHVRRIRAKLRALGVDPIETVHGVGYKASEQGDET